MRPPDSTTGDLLALTSKCRCGGSRRPPIRLFTSAVEAIARAGILASSTPVESFRCQGCKQQVVYTAGELFMGGLRH